MSSANFPGQYLAIRPIFDPLKFSLGKIYKGSVQQKLRWVKSVTNRWALVSYCGLGSILPR
jgi:hypothetical protein